MVRLWARVGFWRRLDLVVGTALIAGVRVFADVPGRHHVLLPGPNGAELRLFTEQSAVLEATTGCRPPVVRRP